MHNNNSDNNNDNNAAVIITIIANAVTKTEIKMIKEEEKLKLKRKEAVLYIIRRRKYLL